MKHSPRFFEIAQSAKQRIRETDARGVKQRIDRGDPFNLIDVREESEWSQGHLPGAMHLSKGVIERDIEKVLPDANADIVLYCGGGFRSALAAENLGRMGYGNVVSMDGGFRDWKNAGYPIES